MATGQLRMPRSAGLVDTVFAWCGLQESEKRPLPLHPDSHAALRQGQGVQAITLKTHIGQKKRSTGYVRGLASSVIRCRVA